MCSLKKRDGTGGLNYLNLILNLIKENQDNEAQSKALSEGVYYPGGLRCQTMLETHHNHVIWLNFHYFDIWRPSVIYCTDVLRIYDGKITFNHALYNSAKT